MGASVTCHLTDSPLVIIPAPSIELGHLLRLSKSPDSLSMPALQIGDYLWSQCMLPVFSVKGCQFGDIAQSSRVKTLYD